MFTDRFLLFDTECTTNVPTDAHVISIGAQMCEFDEKTRKLVPLDKTGWHTFVYSEKESEAAAFAIHKITPDKLVNAPPFPAAMDMFRDYIKPYMAPKTRIYLVAHNAKFDLMVLFCNCVRYRLQFEDFLKSIHCEGFLDTLQMLRKLFSSKPLADCPKDPATGKIGFALGICYQSLCGGKELDGAHDALVDTLALLDVCNTAKLTLSKATLFSFINSRDNGIKALKKSAGMKFQTSQDDALRAGHPIPTLDSDEPIWSEDHRFCLNCVSFTTHDQCDVPFKPASEIVPMEVC